MIKYKGQLYERIDASKYEIIEHNQAYLKLAERRLESKAKSLAESEIKKLEHELGIAIEIEKLEADYMSVTAKAYGESVYAYGQYLVANFKLENGKTIEFDFGESEVNSIDSIIENVSLNEAATKVKIDEILSKIKRQFGKVNKEVMNSLEKYAHEVMSSISHCKNFRFEVKQKSQDEFIVDAYLENTNSSLTNALQRKWDEIDRILVIDESSTGKIKLAYGRYHYTNLHQIVADYNQLDAAIDKAKVSQDKAAGRLEQVGKETESALHSISGVTITKSEGPDAPSNKNRYNIWLTAEPGLKLFIRIEAEAGRITKTIHSQSGSSYGVKNTKFSDAKSTVESLINQVKAQKERDEKVRAARKAQEALDAKLRKSFTKQLPHITAEITSILKAQPYEFESIEVKPEFYSDDSLDTIEITVTSGGKKVDLTPWMAGGYSAFNLEDEHSVADLTYYEKNLINSIARHSQYLTKKVDKHTEAEFNHLVTQLENRLAHFTTIQYKKIIDKKDKIRFSAEGVDSLPLQLNNAINRKVLDVEVTYFANTNKPVIEFYFSGKEASVEDVVAKWTQADKKIAKYIANLNKAKEALQSSFKELMTSLSKIDGLNVREDKNNHSGGDWLNAHYEVNVDGATQRMLKDTAYKGSVMLNTTRDATVAIRYITEGKSKEAASVNQVVNDITALVNKFKAEGAIH